MSTLITGAGGFLGRHLRALVPDAVAPDRSALDLRDPASVQRCLARHRPRLIFHLAAQTCPQRAEREPELTWQVNVVGTRALLDAAGELPACRVVLVSSVHAYGPPQALPIEETHALRPVGVYARSKAAAEQELLLAVERGLDALIARPFNLTGPGQGASFAPADWARQAAAGAREIRCGDLSPERDYMDVRDAARGLVVLAERGQRGQAYNLCRGEAVSMGWILARVAPGALPVVDPQRRRSGVPRLVGSNKKAAALGWAPAIPLGRSLDELVAEVRGA